MKILVIGGTGSVGSQVVKELLKRKVEVAVLTRKSRQQSNLPEKVSHLRGDLLNVKTIRTMCKNVDAVFLLNVVSPTETHEGLMAVNGARMAEVKKIVFLSVHRVDEAPHLPHFGAKLPIEIAIRESGIPYTILRANNFYQNDYWFREALVKYSVYPQPIGNTGLSRVDIRDIAEAAAISLTAGSTTRETLNLVGPQIHTAQSTTEIWSSALGKSISYGGDNLDDWEKQSLVYMPEWLVFDFRLMYAFFQEKGLKATETDIQRLNELLGHSPRKFEDFARATAREWNLVPKQMF